MTLFADSSDFDQWRMIVTGRGLGSFGTRGEVMEIEFVVS